ncbi:MULTISPECIES: hypothetical protein [unclassified Mesorhizobium]|uniref:hypothetical protein n=1 Tax=Mesorhizobium TaxID=68287 RepID=UPI001FE0CE91|nr:MULTISPECIES: hypothetical protein [unclassified Mesorhizobium]MDF3211349.1 hypothetical protein [Mesorhizobium sp. LMG15046]MDF3232578.1 hypothetical protein [Mesorhizobium sp. DSM 30133]
MGQDVLLVEVDDKRVSAADPYPASLNRPPVDTQKPFDTSPLQIGLGNAGYPVLGQYLEIKAGPLCCRQNCATRLRRRFLQQGSNNGRTPGVIFRGGKIGVLYETLDDRTDEHDHDHRDENDCHKLPTHGLWQETADEIPYASSTVAVKM